MRPRYSSTLLSEPIQGCRGSEDYPASHKKATRTVAIRICYYQQSNFSSLIPFFLSLFLCTSTHPRAFSPVGSDGGSEKRLGASAVDVAGCVWVLCRVVGVIFTSTHQGNPV